MKHQVLDALQRFPWKKTSNRTNIGPNIYSMVLGWVKQPFHTPAYHLSKLHNEQPEMFELLCRFVWEHDPTFTFSSITLNKDLQCPPHVDANNVGPSLIIGLGNYHGGELVVEGKKYDIKNKWVKYDGTKTHWTEVFTGERYSLVYYTICGAPAVFRNI